MIVHSDTSELQYIQSTNGKDKMQMFDEKCDQVMADIKQMRAFKSFNINSNTNSNQKSDASTIIAHVKNKISDPTVQTKQNEMF